MLGRVKGMRLLAEPPSALVYRVYTLMDTAGFLLITAKEMQTTMYAAVGTMGLVSMTAKLLAGMVVPAYLVWRNVSTYRNREPMLSRKLLATGPWYFQIGVMLIWSQVLATVIFPVTGVLTATNLPVVPGSLTYDLSSLWEGIRWFGGPAIFAIELTVAREPVAK